jgi:hypothetical protein
MPQYARSVELLLNGTEGEALNVLRGCDDGADEVRKVDDHQEGDHDSFMDGTAFSIYKEEVGLHRGHAEEVCAEEEPNVQDGLCLLAFRKGHARRRMAHLAFGLMSNDLKQAEAFRRGALWRHPRVRLSDQETIGQVKRGTRSCWHDKFRSEPQLSQMLARLGISDVTFSQIRCTAEVKFHRGLVDDDFKGFIWSSIRPTRSRSTLASRGLYARCESVASVYCSHAISVDSRGDAFIRRRRNLKCQSKPNCQT